MKEVTKFEIPGCPQGKGRPRIAVRSAHAHAYTPQKTAEYEAYIRDCYRAALGKYYGNLPIALGVQAIYPIPKRFSKAKQYEALRGAITPQTKPDMDNIVKVVCDALNGVAYDDDKQIVQIYAEKRYGYEAKVVVTVREAGGEL